MGRLNAFQNAFRGVGLAFRSERNIRIQFGIALLAMAGGFFFRISKTEWVAFLLCCGMVIGAELFNTALEKTVDFFHGAYHPEIGKIKDIAAGAVLISAIVSLLVGLLIFVPKVCDFLGC